MIYIKIHTTPGSFITAACDKEIIGKIFREGKVVLNVSERFYKGELVDEKEAGKYFLDAVNLNIIGKNSVRIALDMNLISKESIIIIEGVPHAQSVLL